MSCFCPTKGRLFCVFAHTARTARTNCQYWAHPGSETPNRCASGISSRLSVWPCLVGNGNIGFHVPVHSSFYLLSFITVATAKLQPPALAGSALQAAAASVRQAVSQPDGQPQAPPLPAESAQSSQPTPRPADSPKESLRAEAPRAAAAAGHKNAETNDIARELQAAQPEATPEAGGGTCTCLQLPCPGNDSASHDAPAHSLQARLHRCGHAIVPVRIFRCNTLFFKKCASCCEIFSARQHLLHAQQTVTCCQL